MTRLAKFIPWVLLAYILAMFAMSLSGVGLQSHYLDEYVHIDKLQNYLDHGLYSRIVTVDDSGAPVNVAGFVYVYGPIFSLVGHAIAVAMGAETWGTVATTDTAFVARHIAVALFSFIGVFAAGWAISIVTRSRTWGLAASAMLVSIPMWTGFSMFNIKDMPAATGFTLFTAGCIALTLPADHRGERTRLGGWFALYGGSLVMLGVRPGLWPAIAIAFMAIALIHARLANFTEWKTTARVMVMPVSAFLAAYATMMIVYPVVFLDPVRLLYKSFADTSDFATRRGSITDGEWPTAPPSWDFLPKWAAAQLPEVILILAIAAAAVSVWLVLKRVFSSAPHKLDFALPAIVFIFLQFAAFPLAAILLRAKITSGLRQFLFVIPATAMLVTLFLFLLVSAWNVRRFRFVWPAIVGLVVASTAVTTVIQIQLFPYQMNYFNPTTFSRGIEGRWEVDRWELVEGEAYGQLSASEREHCENCNVKDYPDRYLVAPTGGTVMPFDHGISLSRGPTTKHWSHCDKVHSVSRPYLWSSLDLIYVFDCPVTGEPLESADAVSSPRSTSWWRKLVHWGWQLANEDGVSTAAGSPAAIAWSDTVDSGEPARSATFEVRVSSGSAESVVVSATVNGETVVTDVIDADMVTDFVVTFPASVISRSSTSSVVIEFVLSDDAGAPVTNTLHVSDIHFAGVSSAAIR